MTIGERIYNRRTELKLSVDELAKKLNVNRATIYRYENNEIKKIPASILEPLAKILHTSPSFLMGLEDYPENIKPLSNYGVTKLPIIGSISAGYDGVAQEEYLGEVGVLELALHNYDPAECFVFKVKGNSMYPDFRQDDLVLVHKQQHVDSGSIAVILYNGDEATLKKVKYVQGEDWLELIPRNPEYETKRIEGEDLQYCSVIGKVISLVLRREL